MPKQLAEMIELLITEEKTPSDRNFIKVMDQFVQRIPIIHATTKPEFFIAYFLGGIYNFQYTDLKNTLQVITSFWKYDHDSKTLDLVFEINDQKNNKNDLVFRSITILNSEGSPYTEKFANKRPYPSLVFKDVLFAELNYKDPDHKGGLQFKEALSRTRFSIKLNPDSSAQVASKLRGFGFEKISRDPNVKGIDEKNIKKLSLDVMSVKKELEVYLKGNVNLFKNSKDIFLRKRVDSVKTEAFSHGFLYGSLSLNFKNRYLLDCYVERVAGAGYADLLMISRANGRLANAVPIIIELKAGSATAREAIDQIKEIGYFQHELSLRTYNDQAVIAGVNFNSASLLVDEVPIPRANNLIEEILTTLTDSTPEIALTQQEIQKKLMHVYYSHFGKLNFRSFLSLLVGYVLAFNKTNALENIKKYLFLPADDNNNINYQEALLAIDFENQGAKKTVIFALSAEIGSKTRSQVVVAPGNAIATALNFLCTERKDEQSEVQKVSIRIDPIKIGTDFFASIQVETIDLIAFSAPTTIAALKGNFQKLETLRFDDFFTKKPSSAKEYIFSSHLTIRLQEALFPLRRLFQGVLGREQKEYSFHAAIQGIISGLSKDAYQVRTFVEPNYSAQGRVDLVITLANFNARKRLLAESVFILEFKALALSNNKEALQSQAYSALKQAEKYLENVKSLTDARDLSLMGLVMNINAKLECDFLSEKSAIETVEHASTDERTSSPERSASKRKYADRDESSAEEKLTRRRCRRDVGISCQLDFNERDNGKLMDDLAEARKKGQVILLADSYALLLGLLKGKNSAGKIVILDESIENLNRVEKIVALASQSATQQHWLDEVQRIFPKAADSLARGIAQLGERIDFAEFKALLARGDLVLAKMNGFSTAAPNLNRFRQHLGISDEKIAAIYLGDYEYRTLGSEDSASSLLKRETFKTQILSLLSANERVDIYRRTSANERVITFYSGTKSYLEQKWQASDLISLPSDRQEDVLLSLKIAEEWDRSMKQAALLKPDWIPILQTAGKIEFANEKMKFINLNTYEIYIRSLNGLYSSTLRENLKLLYERIAQADFTEVGISESLSDPMGNAESVDGLNAAFTIQAVFDFMKQKDRAEFQTERGSLYTALQIHHYLNLAQIAHGTVMDANKVVNIVRTLLREEVALAEKPLSSLRLGLKQGASEGLGALLGVASVVLDSVELSAAKTEAEKATFSTQLAFDTGGLSLSLTSMGVAYTGASVAATMLGASTVFVSGLGIGITALVKAFNEVTQRAVAVGVYFFQLNKAYELKGYQKDNQSVMSPLYGAVVTEINFINNTINYGSPYLYRTRHGGFGSGNINYMIWSGTTPAVVRNKTQAINIRERLAYPEKAALGDWETALTWILPDSPIIYIRYGWMILPFATARNDRGFSVLRKLEEHNDFDYDFYVFPSEFIIDTIHEERVATRIKIILDEKQRTLVVPNFSEKDSDIYKNLHYQIEAPAIPSRCSIVLNRVGSLTLHNQHPEYTWVLISEYFAAEALAFTTTGIEVANTPINIAPLHLGKYIFMDKQHSVFMIDWEEKKLLPIEFDFTALTNSSRKLPPYLQDRSSNTSIIVSHFPLRDPKRGIYNGRAYYLPKDAHYVYTANMPENIGSDNHLVGCLADSCYFSHLPDLFWRSHRQTHQLEEKYVFYSGSLGNSVSNKKSSLQGKSQIESVLLQMDGTLKITQTFKNEQGKTTQVVCYHLVKDKLLLFAIADDRLLQILMNTGDKVKLNKQLSFIFNQKPNLSSVWDDYPQLSASTKVAEMDHIVMVMPLAENATSHLVWLRKRAKDRYQLINPQVAEKNLLFLGTLLAADGSEVFYFLRVSQTEFPAQLFRQAEGAVPAKPVNLFIMHAYYAKGMLFILTPENIIKKLNVFGETSIVSFNTEWMAAHRDDWWEKIPELLINEKHQRKEFVTLYGLSDLSGKALGAWYAPHYQSFILMQVPVKPSGEQFHVSYLGRVAELDFFFCDNGILYQQAVSSDAMPTYFQAAQLQKKLPALVPVADSLQSAYFYKQRLYLDQNGLIFSLDPSLSQIRCLEKIEKSWFENEQPDKFFLKNKTRFLQSVQSRLTANYESDFFSANDPFIAMDFSNKTRLLITARKNALISIELAEDKNIWWNPHENTFFYNPFQQDVSDWSYLGVCFGENDAMGVCFFSPKAKMIYFNPDYRGEQVNDTEAYLLKQKFSAELAVAYKTVFLLVLDIPSISSEYFIPLLRDQQNLNLYISSQVGYTFDVPKEIMNHYQVTCYQFYSWFLKNISFSLEGQMNYQKKEQDIILSSPSVLGQWIFLKGMADETWNKTRVDVSYDDGNKSLDFFLKRIRSYLLSRDELSIELSKNYFSSYFAHYAHQGLHRHEVEMSNFSETRIALPAKVQLVSPWLISSSLSLLGVLASGISYVFIRRFRQMRSLTLAERGVVALPLLSLPSKSNAEVHSVVDCHRQGFFSSEQCLQNESTLGLLGYCHNGREALLWFKNTNTSIDTAELLWYALWQHRDPSVLNATLNWQATRVTVYADYLYIDPQGACRQVIELKAIKRIPMSWLFSHLPNEVKDWLQTKWGQGTQEHVLQDAAAHFMARRWAMQIGLNYLVSESLLHTSMGDCFQHLGLKPHWQDQDHRYCVARGLSAGQQFLLGDPLQTNRISTMAALGLETALLHPKLQQAYFNLFPRKNFRHTKQVVRFLADLLQFGGCHFATLPSLLELLFSDYAPAHTIALGLRAVWSLFTISNDPSYYYLGIALFLLPQLPLLLEHLGIPVTSYVSQTLEKLTQFFIFQSLIVQFTLRPDPERLLEQGRTQIAAEQRVAQGRQRLSRVVKPVVAFFKPTTQQNADAQGAEIASVQRISHH